MTRLDAATVHALERLGRLPAPESETKASKYRNERCRAHTPPHASQKECRRYAELALRELAGEIRNLRQQVPFVLSQAVTLDGRRKPPLRYLSDFVYEERRVEPCSQSACIGPEPHEVWAMVVEDVKSPATRKTTIYRAKRHLLKARYGIDIREV